MALHSLTRNSKPLRAWNTRTKKRWMRTLWGGGGVDTTHTNTPSYQCHHLKGRERAMLSILEIVVLQVVLWCSSMIACGSARAPSRWQMVSR